MQASCCALESSGGDSQILWLIALIPGLSLVILRQIIQDYVLMGCVKSAGKHKWGGLGGLGGEVGVSHRESICCELQFRFCTLPGEPGDRVQTLLPHRQSATFRMFWGLRSHFSLDAFTAPLLWEAPGHRQFVHVDASRKAPVGFSQLAQLRLELRLTAQIRSN